MKPKDLLIIIVFALTSTQLLGNNDPIVVTVLDNNKPADVVLIQEIDGPLKLYSTFTEIKKIVQLSDEIFRDNGLTLKKQYYLGKGETVELITPGNFKKIARKYFTEFPELYQKIGKRGFRYENLPFMIMYHNKQVDKGSPLTKEDVKHWTMIDK